VTLWKLQNPIKYSVFTPCHYYDILPSCRVSEKDEILGNFDLAKARHTAVTEEITDKRTRLSTINAFLHALRMQDALLTEFDEKLRCSLVDYATVYDKDDVRFTFKDGRDIMA